MSGPEFVALDVETANSNRGSICAVGLTVVESGQIVQHHSWLCRPPSPIGYFDAFNTALHGISPEKVAKELPFHQRIGDILDIIGNRPIVAHNAAFDIGAIRDACDADGLTWPTLTYGCTLVWARRVLNLVSYRLPIVAAELGVTLSRHHDASEDAHACAEIFLKLAGQLGSRTVREVAEATHTEIGTVTADAWHGCHGITTSASYNPVTPTSNAEADPSHPLYGQVVVFTGALSMRRQDAWGAVASLGGLPEKGVTSRTTRLVIGGGFVGDDPREFRSGKAGRVATLRDEGKSIEILTESDFESLLNDGHTSGRPAAEAPRRKIEVKQQIPDFRSLTRLSVDRLSE
jgi:DNA polymerase III subunit epsilon